MTPLPVTIVVPARNRNTVWQAMAPTYLNQGCKELVIVDDASHPPLQPVSANAATSVRWIRLDQRVRQAEARMVGTRAATQPYVFFGEDDAFLSEGCIRNLFGFVERRDFEMAAPQLITVKVFPDKMSGVPEARKVSQASEIIDYRLMQIDCGCQPVAPIQVPWLHATALMHRETILELGYDSGYRGNAYREETDFYVRANAAGMRLAFVPGPPAFHYKGPLNSTGAREARQALLTEYWVARNNFRFLCKNQSGLKQAGITVAPLPGTLALVAWRARWYWRRLALKARAKEEHPLALSL